MKYIVTKFFEKEYKKIVKNVRINEFINKINVESRGFIGFKTPFYKIKFNLDNKAYRVVVSYEKDDCIILFINIFDKKDKNIGKNLSWQLHKSEIIKWADKNMECIKNGDYYNIYN